MNKQTLDQIWDLTRQKYGVYLRVIEAIPKDRFHIRPIDGMRTPTELVVHTSGLLRMIAQGVAKGEITADERSDSDIAGGLATRADVIAFARECWDDASAAVASIGDAELAAMVPTPWEVTFPGHFQFTVLSDEFVHHRGQLYVFARACGAEPPFVWSFGDNAEEFRPA